MTTEKYSSRRSAVWQYIEMRKQDGFNAKVFSDICYYIADAFLYWTGHTYVGQPKDNQSEARFQDFFLSLCALIDFLTQIHDNTPLETDFIESVVYRGIVYRYLGTAGKKNTRNIPPRYSDIYVSWSKNPQSYYIESKLHGKYTVMSCAIKPPLYGIDIEGFNNFFNTTYGEHVVIAKANEREVVFPTVEGSITSISYKR